MIKGYGSTKTSLTVHAVCSLLAKNCLKKRCTNSKLHFLYIICQYPIMNYLTAVARLPVQLIWAWPGSTTPSQLVSPVVKPQLTLQILLWLLTLLIIITGNLQTWNCRSIFIILFFVPCHLNQNLNWKFFTSLSLFCSTKKLPRNMSSERKNNQTKISSFCLYCQINQF